MPNLSAKVREFLDSHEYRITEEDGIFRTGLKGVNASFDIVIVASDENARVEVFALHDFLIPESKRLLAADFVARANCHFSTVKYEIDMDDGELKASCVVNFEDTTPSSAMLEDMVNAPATVADVLYTGMMKVIHADMPPKAAFAEVLSSLE